MEKKELEEILYCLPKDRTLFYYFKDRYALLLLSLYLGEGKKIADLRRSPFAGLLEKPLLKKVLSESGKGLLTPWMLEAVWPEAEVHPFVLTVGSWGGKGYSWQQVSRPGYNLVLQMNFSNSHEKRYLRLAKPKYENYFNYSGHPVFGKGKRSYFRNTMAWARIDLDFNYNEALIEEIQTDWVRNALNAMKCLLKCKDGKRKERCYKGLEGSNEAIISYVRDTLGPYLKIWDEAMLACAIDFIYRELGISNIYYHTFDTGKKVKKIGYSAPPRSLYTTLPRKFAFNRTDEAPEFLMASKGFRKRLKYVDRPEWHVMRICA